MPSMFPGWPGDLNLWSVKWLAILQFSLQPTTAGIQMQIIPLKCHFLMIRLANVRKFDNRLFWWWSEKQTLSHCLWEYKLVQSPEAIRQFLTKWHVQSFWTSNSTARDFSYRYICVKRLIQKLFILASFLEANAKKQPKPLSRQLVILWDMNSLEYYNSVK